MLIVLSPSKTVNFKQEIVDINSTSSLFEKDADELNSRLLTYVIDEIIQKEKISLQIARSTYENIQTFSLKNAIKKPAVFAFDGNVYDKLKAKDFGKEELSFVQNHVRIFSALYGILRPFDLIKPYRLDMNSKLINGLYDFWREKVTQKIIRLLSENDKILINLASTEYFKLIDLKQISDDIRIITPVFQQEKSGKYITNALFAKHARGLMTRFIAENQIDNPEYLKAFDSEGYYFNPHLSRKNEWYFTR